MEWNAELEAVVRANPDNPAAWSVLEDWALEQGGLRARIVERKKAGDEKASWEATWALERESFGEQYGFLQRSISCAWRAGYIVSCSLKGRGDDRVALLDRVLSLRCSALLTDVQVDLDAPDELVPLLRRLETVPVREFRVNAFWKPTLPVVLDPAWLAPLAIERLHLRGRAIALPWRPELRRLTQLSICPGAPGDLTTLFEQPARLPRLVELTVYCRTFEHRSGIDTAAFELLFTGVAAPQLRRLDLRDISAAMRDALVERLASSPLLSRLGHLSFDYRGLELESVPEKHRAAFSHLK